MEDRRKNNFPLSCERTARSCLERVRNLSLNGSKPPRSLLYFLHDPNEKEQKEGWYRSSYTPHPTLVNVRTASSPLPIVRMWRASKRFPWITETEMPRPCRTILIMFAMQIKLQCKLKYHRDASVCLPIDSHAAVWLQNRNNFLRGTSDII